MEMGETGLPHFLILNHRTVFRQDFIGKPDAWFDALPSQERRNLGDYSVAAAIFTIATGAVGGTIGTVFGSWLYDI